MVPLGVIGMVLVVIVLFNAVRQPVIIFMIVPLAIIGVTIGLLITGIAMEFIAILGVLSLSGLLIKNAIVLVDQMDIEIGEGKPRFDAIIEAAYDRARPVILSSLTTVLGVIPLLFDAFFKAMAVVLAFGLTFGTVLTCSWCRSSMQSSSRSALTRPQPSHRGQVEPCASSLSPPCCSA